MQIGDKIYYIANVGKKQILRNGEIVAEYPSYYVVKRTIFTKDNKKRTYSETVHKSDQILRCYSGSNNSTPAVNLLTKSKREQNLTLC